MLQLKEDRGPVDFKLKLERVGDANLFVLSLHQLRATVVFLHNIIDGDEGSNVEAALQKFDLACPQLRRFRNVLSHFDDYAAGKGVLQKGKPDPGFKYSSGGPVRGGAGVPDGGPEHVVRVEISPNITGSFLERCENISATISATEAVKGDHG